MTKPTAPCFRPLSTFYCWMLVGCSCTRTAVCVHGTERRRGEEEEERWCEERGGRGRTWGRGRTREAARTTALRKTIGSHTQRRVSSTWDLSDKTLAWATEWNIIMYLQLETQNEFDIDTFSLALIILWISVEDKSKHSYLTSMTWKCMYRRYKKQRVCIDVHVTGGRKL